jgi:glycosyltransferase involved in cell wall biosynthesis
VKVAFVVQRCGLEVNGGAEAHCLQVAQRMAKHWDTEILTTCALDYMTWENFYAEGMEQIGATLVRRFPVDRARNVEFFNRLSSELHARQAETTLEEQEEWMRAQGPISTPLFAFLNAQGESYDAFIFFGYLYATTYFGLPSVRGKAFLAPLAHDEWPIYFAMWDNVFSLPVAFIFNTAAERKFLQRRFSTHALPGPVAGIGIEPPKNIDSEGFGARYHLTSPFLLYVGRIDESKGCATMFDYFIRWRQSSDTPCKLVLLGKEIMPVPFHDDIIHLGFVSEEEKWAAMKGCTWLLMPSPHESLSMVLLEAWSVGRPALVNAQCDVLTAHCRESNGGLWYRDFDEWNATLSIVDSEIRDTLGRQGKAYVRECYSWDRVEGSYLRTVDPAFAAGDSADRA